eukprot:Skav206152  [mRNA]  locus=scaffold1545:82214:83194:- [translate_table: standard]
MTYREEETFAETLESTRLVQPCQFGQSLHVDFGKSARSPTSGESHIEGLSDWRQCLLQCLGPLFGWLGFSFLDGWWPEKHFSAAEWRLYHAQQSHTKHVENIMQAMQGKHVKKEELRSAVLAFGRDQSETTKVTELTAAELKAMFYFAECQKDGHMFLAFLQTNLGLEDGVDWSVSVEHILEAFGRWPRESAGAGTHHM